MAVGPALVHLVQHLALFCRWEGTRVMGFVLFWFYLVFFDMVRVLRVMFRKQCLGKLIEGE